MNYSRKLGRLEGGENSGPRSASPIGLGAEITDHRGSGTVPYFQQGVCIAGRKDTLQRWV